MKNILLFFGITCISFVLLSCTSTTPPTGSGTDVEQTNATGSQTQQTNSPTSQEDVEAYIGLTLPDAQALAEKNGDMFRVIEEDGKPLPTTRDFRPGRINATVLQGKVTFVEIEGTETVYDANSWEAIIPETCMNFFDGCNNCVRNPDNGIVACTQKACFQYKRPQCLNNVTEENQETDVWNSASE